MTEGRTISLSTAGASVPGEFRRLIGDASGLIWLAPGLIMLGVLFIMPIAIVFSDSVSDPSLGFSNYAALWNDPLYSKVIWNSIRSALLATISCLLIGYPTAYGIFTATPRWRQLLLAGVLFSFAVGTVPRTFSWLVILGDRGLINNLYFWLSGSQTPIHLLYNQFGVVVGMVHVMLPFMVLILLGSMARVGPRLVPAARTLGASPLRAFFEVFLPLTAPGVIAGSMLVFVYSLGFYLVPAVLGGAAQTTVVMQVESLAMRSGIWGMAAALSALVIVASISGAALYVKVTKLSDINLKD